MGEWLSGHRRWSLWDVEDIRDALDQTPTGLRYDPLPYPDAAGPMVLNVATVGALHVSYLAHGRPARVHYRDVPASVEPFLIVLFPLTGRMMARSGNDVFAADGRAAVLLDYGPHRDPDIDMVHEPDTEFIAVRFNLCALKAQLAKMLGRPPASRLDLNSSLDTSTPAMRSWMSTVGMVCRDLDGPRGLCHPALVTSLQQLVLGQLLTAVPAHGNPDLVALHDPTPPAVTPRVIRRADQLITDHAHEALTVADIAEAVGISVRSLQEGFRRHLDTTPTARLLHARLVGVHAALRAADPQRDNVSRLAHDWGFTHLGRFAHAYRQTFHESPSHTLRR